MSELFDESEVQSLSPRLKWMKDNGISYIEDKDGFKAFFTRYGNPKSSLATQGSKGCGVGDTADEALEDMAISNGIPFYSE